MVISMKKKTEDLVNEIVAGNSISLYLDTNQNEFLEIPLHEYLKSLLLRKNLKVSQIVERSYKGEYVYQVFRGIKNPGRDVIICIALAMELGLDESQYLLRIARMPHLDVRNRRDSIIIFAINRKLTVPEANDILYEYNEVCL